MLERIALILQIVLFSACIFMCFYSLISLKRLKKMNNQDTKDKGYDWLLFTSKEDLINNRNHKGWTQLELAEYSGIHPSAIKEFEEGVRVPSNPIQRMLYLTFERLEHTIQSYSKLGDKEKTEFNNKFNLVKQSVSINREY